MGKHFTKYDVTPAEYLLARIYIDPLTDCWNWRIALTAKGYAPVKYKNGKTPGIKVSYAHQLSYVLWKGPIPQGLLVCHSCDNRKCCNPKHLFLGTSKDNTHDMLRKGRHYHKEYDTVTIHSLRNKGFTLAKIAELTGVPETSVTRVLNEIEKTNLKPTHRTGRNVNPVLD